MKHKFKYLTLGLILSLGAGFASCGADDDEVVDPYASIYDKDKDKEETDPDKQKAEEEKAAKEAEKQRQQQEEKAKQRAADSTTEANADTISLEAVVRRSRIVGELHVDGRYLKDEQGNIVNLHGIAQTYSPWFNRVNDQYLWICASAHGPPLDQGKCALGFGRKRVAPLLQRGKLQEIPRRGIRADG